MTACCLFRSVQIVKKRFKENNQTIKTKNILVSIEM